MRDVCNALWEGWGGFGEMKGLGSLLGDDEESQAIMDTGCWTIGPGVLDQQDNKNPRSVDALGPWSFVV